MLIYRLILVLFGIVNSGRISPYGRTPVLLSVNNANKLSDYTFTFVLETDTYLGNYQEYVCSCVFRGRFGDNLSRTLVYGLVYTSEWVELCG